MERVSGTYTPTEHIKVGVRFAPDRRLVQSRNIILARNAEHVEKESLIFLGKVLAHTPQIDYCGFNVWLDVSYPYVVLIPGRRGTGKSYTIGVLVEGLALTGKDTPASTKKKGDAIVLFDALGQFWQMRYSPSPKDKEGRRQLEDLSKWNLEPLGIPNVQVFVPSGRRVSGQWRELFLKFSEVEASEIAGLLDVDLYQDRMGQLLYHIYTKVREEGYQSVSPSKASCEIERKEFIQPKTDFTIQDLVTCIDTESECISQTGGYELQTRRGLRSRLQSMLRWKIFSQEGTPISEVFKENFLTVVNLEGIDEMLRNLIVAVLTRKIFQAREMSRKVEKLVEIGETPTASAALTVPAGWLVIDEAHEFCPSGGRTAAREPLIRFAKEGRSMGLGLILATQQPSALSEKISSQVEIVISHALAFNADIQSLKDRLVNGIVSEFLHSTVSLSFEEQVRMLPPGAAVVSAVGIPTIFLMQLRPRLTLHGGKAPRMG